MIMWKSVKLICDFYKVYFANSWGYTSHDGRRKSDVFGTEGTPSSDKLKEYNVSVPCTPFELLYTTSRMFLYVEPFASTERYLTYTK